MPGAFDCGERARNELAEKQRARLYIETCAPTPDAAATEEIPERPTRFTLSLFGHVPNQGVAGASSAGRDAFRAISLNHLDLSPAARPFGAAIRPKRDPRRRPEAAGCLTAARSAKPN